MKLRNTIHTINFLMSIIGICVISSFPCRAQSKIDRADSLFETGQHFLTNGNIDSAIQCLRNAMHLSPDSAAFHYQLGLALMEKGTVRSRFLANLEFKEALRLDRDNIEYRFNYAMLLLDMSMQTSAIQQLKRVIKEDPNYYLAYYHLGLLKEADVMRYRYMIDPEEAGIIYFYEFAQEDKEKAVYYYNKVISLKPDFPDVYYHLGMLYYEYNELFDMIDLLERAVKIIPKDKNCHLFLGFAYYQDEQYKCAEKEFEESMKYMTPEERNIFNSIEPIITPEEKMKLTTDLANYNRNVSEMWQSRDPLILTEINERKLEHYSRVAYTNLRFSDFDKGIEGWNTDQGKVYIRFGKPETLYRTRPEIGTSGDGNPRNPLNHSKEVWLYPDFEYIFEDRFLQHRYAFAWGNTPENDYQNVFDRMISVQPDYYDFIQKDHIIEMATDITKFRGTGQSTKINLSYAIPADSIHFVYQENTWKSRLNQGIFLLNDNWKKVYQSSKMVQFEESEQFGLSNENYLLHQEDFENRTGKYHLIFEINDLESKKHASIRSEINIKSFEHDELALSDIQLAFKIEQDSTGGYYYTRDDLNFVPNPFKRFITGHPVFIYYEIYNLQKNESGLTSFNVEYTISPDKTNINPIKKMLQRLNLFNQTGEITTSYQIEGDSETEYQYRHIGLGSFSPGSYSLTLRITDLNANKTTTENIQFKLEDE